MGGDYIPSSDEDSCVEEDFLLLSSDSPTFFRDDVSMKFEDGAVNGGRGVDFQEPGEEGSRALSFDFEVNERRRHNIKREILQSYDDLRVRCKNLKEAKEKILSYTPGAWTERVGGLKLTDHEVPNTTCLILVGPKASGKSSLINRISKVFDNDKFAPVRAQVSYNSPIGDGTYFLQEYMIPRDSTSFCLYDTRSLSDNSEENDRMLRRWMTKGVHHGELVVRNMDDQSLRKSLKCKARHGDDSFITTRKVNYVIYVVSGLSVLKAMESTGALETRYIETIASTFNSPYLSLKDDKPVLVVTHGDLLSLSDRTRVRAYLGEVLGIPPAKQIFDISESDDPVTDFTITEMLRYTLEHADRNYPLKSRVIDKVYKTSLPSLSMILLNLLVGVAILLAIDMFIGTFHCPHAYSGEPCASHSVKPKIPSHVAKQEAPSHYAEPEVPSHDAAKPEVFKHQAKREVPSHHAEPEVPSHQMTEVPSHDTSNPEVLKHQAKPKIPSHQAKQEVPSHYAEPEVASPQTTEVASHDAAKPEVFKNQEKPKIPSHYAKQEVPSCQTMEVPSHYAANPEVLSLHDVAKPEALKRQAKQEVPYHYAELEVPFCQTGVPSQDAVKPEVLEHQAKPKIPYHHAKQEVPSHYAEPEVPSCQTEVPSHDAVKPEVLEHQAKPKIPSAEAKHEVPSDYAESEVSSHQTTEVLSHDAAKPNAPMHKAKLKIPSHLAKQKVPSHHKKPKVYITEPKIVWHKIRYIW